jgi:hypothetical protein
MKAIINNYSKLLASGFLANAKQELRLAQTTLQSSLEDEYDEYGEYEDFYWSFTLATKKTEFDLYFNELGVGKFVASRIDLFLKKKDAAIALYTPDGFIYCGYSKKAVKEMANHNYQTFGLMPYYTTKRKIQGRMMWFCIAWNALSFNLPNYN